MLPKSDSLAFLEQQFELLHQAASEDPEARIPSCPDWSSTDLVVHLDRVYRFVIGVLAGNHETRPEPLGNGIDPFKSLADNATVVFEDLSRLPEDAQVWNWRSDPTPGWWLRRMCNETLIHRIDAELGVTGSNTDIHPTWASDSLDEVFSNFLGAPRLNWKAAAGASVHVHSTDAQGEWLLIHTGEDVTLTREHTKADLAIKGSAQDLLLFVYGRGNEANLQTFGSQELLKTFQQLCI